MVDKFRCWWLCNDVGRRILELQTSLALLSMPRPSQLAQDMKASDSIDDIFNRSIFEGLDNVSDHAKAKVLNRQRLYNLACEYKLREVTRWKPKKVRRVFSQRTQHNMSADEVPDLGERSDGFRRTKCCRTIVVCNHWGASPEKRWSSFRWSCPRANSSAVGRLQHA